MRLDVCAEAEQPSVAATPKATDSGNSIETLAETTPGKRGRRWGAASAAAIFVEPSDEEASEDGSEDTEENTPVQVNNRSISV